LQRHSNAAFFPLRVFYPATPGMGVTALRGHKNAANITVAEPAMFTALQAPVENLARL
jgi:hypothetical protein